ncbi:hypothetical protein ACFE04_016283 [Oxalis oulophora]
MGEHIQGCGGEEYSASRRILRLSFLGFWGVGLNSRSFSHSSTPLLSITSSSILVHLCRFREDSGKRLTRSADGNVNFSSTYYDYRLSADNYSVGRSSRGELHTKLCWSHAGMN